MKILVSLSKSKASNLNSDSTSNNSLGLLIERAQLMHLSIREKIFATSN